MKSAVFFCMIAALEATLPSSINTVQSFNKFFEDSQIAEMSDSIPDGQVAALFNDYCKTIGSKHMGGKTTEASALPHDEYQFRLAAFGHSLNEIMKKNADESKGGEPRAYFGINVHSDWTHEEFLSERLGYKPEAVTSGLISHGATVGETVAADEAIAVSSEPSVYEFSNATELAGSCGEIRVNNVRSQGQCGACWAFSAVEVFRYEYQRAYREDPGPLSAQYLVDCIPQYQHKRCSEGSKGCCGGNFEEASAYVAQHGIPTVAAYGSWTGGAGQCKSWVRKAIQVAPPLVAHNENQMAQWYCSKGAFVIGVEGGQLQHYTGGLLTPNNCRSGNVNHAVIVVGFINYRGTYAWVMQNSWGTHWGTNERGTSHDSGGFALLKYGTNTCGIVSNGGGSFTGGVFSSRHPWPRRPLFRWEFSGMHGPNLRFSTPSQNLGRHSLPACEVAAEKKGATILIHMDDGTCKVPTTASFSYGYNGYSTDPQGKVYKKLDAPALVVEEMAQIDNPEGGMAGVVLGCLGFVAGAAIVGVGVAINRRRIKSDMEEPMIVA